MAVLAAAVPLAFGAAASSKPKPKPPKPKPKLELLTTTQEEALRKRAIKVRVDSRRGKAARVQGTFVVDGFPDDFIYPLGPDRKELRRGSANFRFPLSVRKREVLDFAIKSCRPATVDVRVKVGRGKKRLKTYLERPEDCQYG